MKKLISMLLALCMALTMAACGPDRVVTPTTAPTKPAVAAKLNGVSLSEYPIVIDEDALETGVKVFVQFVLDHMGGIEGMTYPQGGEENG